MIAVVTAATLNTVQDLGRLGLRRLGIGCSGAMDPVALRCGNILLGNDEGAAAIEVQTFPFSVRFLAPRAFAVTGADSRPSLDGTSLPPWWAALAMAGQTLTLARPERGTRAYLAIQGGFDVPVVLGSRSTHLRAGFGGLHGRPLRDGDRLPAGPAAMPLALPLGMEPPRHGPDGNGAVPIRAIPASDHDDFPAEAQAAFWSQAWRVSAQSNRHGYRLQGPALPGADGFDLRSAPILPGVVQVPPGGAPIVQMSDANSAGGYPRMAAVIAADLPSLGQVPLGGHIRFVPIGYDGALAAEREQDAFLRRARRMAALLRARLAEPDRAA